MNPRQVAIAPVLLAMLVATNGLAVGQGAIAGLTSTATEQRPDPSGSGMLTDTDSTTLLSVSSGMLTLKHTTVITHPDQTVFRRAASNVTVPLNAVTLTKGADGIEFACNGGEQCIHWVHTDFYDQGGATFGDAGATSTYGLIMGPDSQARFLAALCPMTTCT